MNIEFGKALYGYKGEIKTFAARVNKSGIAGGAGCSSKRMGVMGSPKVSAAGRIFDLLFFESGDIYCYESTVDDSILVRVHDKIIRVTSNTYECEKPDELTNSQQVIPRVLYELSSFGKNDELYETFKAVIEGFDKTELSEDDLFLFCDSFYYGCIKAASNMQSINEGHTEKAELEAAFRSGAYVRSKKLYDAAKKYLGTSEYEGIIGKKETKKKTAKSCDEFKKDALDGKYHIAYEWPDFMKPFIVNQKYIENYTITPETVAIVKKMVFHLNKILERMDMGMTEALAIAGDCMNILFTGKPGTGKTALAYAVSAITGMPICTIALNKHTDEDEFEGKTRIVEGHPEFVETDFLKFFKNGGIIVLEETNLPDPSVMMGGIGQALEYPYIVKENGYETVHRNPLAVIIGTMNVGTNGSNPMNEAYLNRFPTPYTLNDPTRETFIDILMKKSGESKEVCKWAYDAYDQTVAFLMGPDVNEEDMVNNLSIRSAIGLLTNMQEGQNPRDAYMHSIYGTIAAVDREVAERVKEGVVKALPNPTF